MCVAFLLAKLSLNYSGVCTEGLLIWKWHRTESRELLARLQENGSINAGVHAEYKLVEEWQVPGDHYQPSSFMDKIEGNAATLVSYHLPWLDGGGYLITGGYFYAPNCIREWRLPR
ncbi:hypothetical protein EV286_11094 [Rhizobium sp. BK251]|nr:hypothetical protein EV286_11094 [Rhizobium sp. BK251]